LALSGEGGALYNTNGVACGGEQANVTLASTFVGQTGTSINANRAAFGGGIFNENGDGFSSLSLQAGTRVVHNSASITGGVVFTSSPGALSASPGVVIFLNSPNNLLKTSVCP